MTPAELAAAATLPSGLTPEAEALWHARHGSWESAHNIAQDIPTKLGSWIHALLHVIEGDQWNADYWFSKAGRPSRGPTEVDDLWQEIAATILK
jgi:hypothetical protein